VQTTDVEAIAMHDAEKYATGITSCIRTIALAEPDNKLIAFRNMAREAARYVVKGGVDKCDFADRFTSAAIANGIVQRHGTDAVQAILEEALIEASPLKIADISDHPVPVSARSSARPRIVSAATLRTKVFEPIRFCVPKYIPPGCGILAGRPNLGKSWLMLDVGLAVASGGNCLNQVITEEGDVLYLALEDNERRLQSRMTRILGFAHEWPERFHYATEWRRAAAGGLDAVRDWIERSEKPRLIVVDVLAMFRSPRGGKQTPYDADFEAIHELQKIAAETDIAIVIVHHLRKGAADTDPFDKISGTLALSGAADTVLILDRDSNGTTLYGRGRDIEEFETALQFDRMTCRWRVLGEAAEVRRTDQRSAILSALEQSEEPLSPAEIAEATGMVRNNVKQLLLKMAKAGQVLKAKDRGRYMHPKRADDVRVTPSNHDNQITNRDE
jgi:AAA domain/IclR helix-turn-helix domain